MSDNAWMSGKNCENICLNYTDFLSESCKKKWRFVDAIYGVMPVFGMVTRKPAGRQQTSAESLKVQALQVISIQLSDEMNIVRLIILAEQQKLTQFDILLPYAFSEEQLGTIRQEYRKPVCLTQQGERLTVQLLSMMESTG